ncbi:hypothetical protein TRL7639_02120 [Falsiruegeria litorea R37]|uniref:Uncharacterized protein n=1 Tax=Falsiruegeria litorea R37 TaxID=1200284 RepID=A0A1Y5SME5_9RHOB|nr:hypothetical protein [Falsiruegeria litorea]SLN40993.1 hypothetical protein TRL7639_02120 [Falsiruegeria litorea R37]
MFDQETAATRALLNFLAEHNEALQNAALVLGGSWALRRVQHLLDHLVVSRELNRRVRQDLVALHQVFTLQNVGDPERIETVLFAGIDPEDPMVEDICLLSDQLEDHMRAIDAVCDVPAFDLSIAA